jgi:hypothetical protein
VNLTHVLESALGQLVAIAVVVVAWTIVQLWRFLSTFYAAARSTQVKIVCEKKP